MRTKKMKIVSTKSSLFSERSHKLNDLFLLFILFLIFEKRKDNVYYHPNKDRRKKNNKTRMNPSFIGSSSCKVTS